MCFTRAKYVIVTLLICICIYYMDHMSIFENIFFLFLVLSIWFLTNIKLTICSTTLLCKDDANFIYINNESNFIKVVAFITKIRKS